jgi:uncharacterized protein with FMN-binding domain
MIPKRALGALVVTVFALAMLFSFKTAHNLAASGATTGGAVAVGAAPSTVASPATTPGSAGATSTPTTAAASPTATAGTKSATTTAYKNGTVTGSAITTRFGNVQVQVTIAGGAIANVTALQLPNRDGRSQQIASQAEPILRQEALTAQSAKIDLLSGATYTSDAYARSLQSALDQVRA